MATTLIDQGSDGGRDPKKTTVIRPIGGRGTELVQPERIGDSESETVEPVVAWLVIVGGPGQGKSFELSYGMSIVGRGRQNRVQIDFGDGKISDDDHFRIAYDGENREFHLIPGRGTNLVYVGGKPLLTAQTLSGGMEFRVGATTLRFIPLCSRDWDWRMVETAPSAA